MNDILETRNPNSCFIELLPKCEGSYWTGEVELNIIASHKSNLDEESKRSLLHLSQLVAASMALMEKDPSLYARLEDFVSEPDDEVKPKVTTSIKGNVVSLNFTSEKKQ
jgi:hypothetical protein